MLRFGNITEVLPDSGYARVKFIDDGIVSAPLQILVKTALSDKDNFVFDINEQVAVMMDINGEEGVILGALFNDNTKPSSGNAPGKYKIQFSDDSFVEYDKNSHKYTINVQGDIDIIASGTVKVQSETAQIEAETVSVEATTVSVDATVVNVDAEVANIDATAINMTGVVTVTGSMTVSGAVAAASISAPVISGPGVSMESGNLEASGELKGTTVVAGTIDLGSHVHAGVQPGGGSTAPPTP